ncbi:MAG TPA: outer membrane lipoprotein carrier protein LolA [Opitutaceae bacterium]|nr:outer membrane lipoprotein carrier protein LolA [Opitutaceae bacterium]
MFRRVLLLVLVATAVRADPPAALAPVNAADPAWRQLAEEFAHQPDLTANFEERRWFPFRREPVELTGEVRVSQKHGLSLHYRTPGKRIVILDQEGLLIRDATGQSSGPNDPRAAIINHALLHILRLDLSDLQTQFDVQGSRNGPKWTIELSPREPQVARMIGRIIVTGVGRTVGRIELRHGGREFVQIDMARPFPSAPFSAEDLKRYFR